MTDTTEIQRRDFLATAATTPLVVWDDDEEDDCGLIDQILNRCEPGVDPDSITIEMGPERPDSPDDPQVFVQTDTEGGDPQVIWTFNDGNWSVAGGRGTEENPVPEQHVREQHSDVLHTERTTITRSARSDLSQITRTTFVLTKSGARSLSKSIHLFQIRLSPLTMLQTLIMSVSSLTRSGGLWMANSTCLPR